MGKLLELVRRLLVMKDFHQFSNLQIEESILNLETKLVLAGRFRQPISDYQFVV